MAQSAMWSLVVSTHVPRHGGTHQQPQSLGGGNVRFPEAYAANLAKWVSFTLVRDTVSKTKESV